MAAVHRISEDFYEDSYTLIALHSSLEDYAIVYALNLYFKSKFVRLRKDLSIAEYMIFPVFEWKDKLNDRYWTLVSNRSLEKEQISRTGLFKEEATFITNYLLPEYKDVDYFIKIEHDEDETFADEIIKSLLKVEKIRTAYAIETNKLKSKNNLIY